jgi:hypothetical protein
MQHQVIPTFLPLLFPFVFAAFWCFISLVLGFVSGWQRLALAYATDQAPRGGTAFSWQSGYVGVVRYRNCLNVRVAPEGLFLSTVWLFRLGHKPLLIPWSAIHNPEPRQIFWFHFTRFQIGEPCIAHVQIPTKVFEAQRVVA